MTFTFFVSALSSPFRPFALKRKIARMGLVKDFDFASAKIFIGRQILA